MFNIVLVHPQIPQNTGAIGRMCVNANLKLHIVKPTVFDLSEKAVRRAGLDYWKILDPQIWESLDEFLETNLSHKERFFFATTKTNRHIQRFLGSCNYSQEQVVLRTSTRHAAAVTIWHVSTPVEACINASDAGERRLRSADR